MQSFKAWWAGVFKDLQDHFLMFIAINFEV